MPGPPIRNREVAAPGSDVEGRLVFRTHGPVHVGAAAEEDLRHHLSDL